MTISINFYLLEKKFNTTWILIFISTDQNYIYIVFFILLFPLMYIRNPSFSVYTLLFSITCFFISLLIEVLVVYRSF